MLSVVALNSVAYAPTVLRAAPTRAATCMAETAAGLEALAEKCNPKIGFYDPLGIVKKAVEDKSETATLGWYRHAEIKHGRVAMAAFVGYCVQANGITLPGALTTSGITYADISAAGGPADQWDALPTAAKMQIIGAVGVLELVSECTPFLRAAGEEHYVKGGKPGFYPPFSAFNDQLPHPLPLNLFDPFGFSKNKTPEQKERGLVIEINNGRLAMIGIFGFVAKSKGLIVPGLDSVDIPSYSGEYMAPFTASDALPYVADMTEIANKMFPWN